MTRLCGIFLPPPAKNICKTTWAGIALGGAVFPRKRSLSSISKIILYYSSREVVWPIHPYLTLNTIGLTLSSSRPDHDLFNPGQCHSVMPFWMENTGEGERDWRGNSKCQHLLHAGSTLANIRMLQIHQISNFGLVPPLAEPNPRCTDEKTPAGNYHNCISHINIRIKRPPVLIQMANIYMNKSYYYLL